MKKAKVVLSVVLAIVALLTMSVIYVAAATEEGVEGYYSYTKFNSKVTITDVDTAISGDVVVPSTLDGCDVITIGEYAFEGCDKVTSITVPDGITTINRGAFKGMAALESVTVPFTGKTSAVTNYTSTFGYAFDYTSTETEGAISQGNGYYYYIPETIKSVTVTSDAAIPDYAFYGMTNLESATLSAATSTGNYTFKGCTSLEDAKIASATSVGNYAFNGCTNLKDVALTSAKTIGNYAFAGCTSMTGVNMGSAVTSIGDYAFQNCSALTSLPVSDSVKTIGKYAYENVSNITELVVPDSVTSIGVGAFKGLNDLTSVTVPFVGNTPSSTGYSGVFGYIFGYTTTSGTSGTTQQYSDSSKTYYYYIPTSIKTIKITTDTSIPAYAFYNCANVTGITLSAAESIDSYAFGGCEKLGNFTLPQTLKVINSYAFYNLDGITSVVIPDAVTSIGQSAFAYCNNIETITFSDSLKTIANYAFQSCSNVETIKFSNTLTTIGSYAFDGCSKVMELNLPSSLKTINGYAFRGLSAVKELVVPNSVTSIGSGAFKGMNSLESITLPFVGSNESSSGSSGVFGYIFDYTESNETGTTYQYYYSGSYSNKYYYYYIPTTLRNVTITKDTTIPDYAFNNCSFLTEINLPETVTSIGSYAFSDCSGLTEMLIPDSVTKIGTYCFYDCSGLKNISISEKITSIPDDAFYGCTNLSNVELPSALKTIGANAFYNCDGFTAIVLPDTVTSVGNYAFQSCSNVETIKFSNTLTTIGDYAFDGCSKITALNFPATLKTIGSYAFRDCKIITEITVPNSVTTIGVGAFKGMTALEKMTVPFVGNTTTSSGYSGVFGYIFGYTDSNATGTIYQYTISGSYSNKYYYYYVPTSLRSITVTTDTTIPENAFYNCSFLTEVNLPSIATTIGSNAFRECSGLAEMVIPDSVTTIGNYCFYNCSGINALHISNNVTSVGSSAFTNCTNLTVFGHSDSYIETYCTENSVPFVAYENAASISITALPENNQYPGKPVDTTGMKIKVVLNDGTETIITSGFTVSPAIVPDSGEQTITVSFGSAETTFNINAKGVNGVSLLSSPAKTNYVVGDTIDLTGLKLQVYYSDGTTAVATEGFTANVETLESAGNKLITVTYYGKTANFRVSVVALQATLLEIETLPSKTDYFVGDEIDTTGLVIKATYNNGKTASVTGGFTVTTVLDSADVTEVVIEHAGKTVSYPIKVTAVVSTGWTLATEPTKLKYIIGENIDTTGLTITEYYNNGNVATITEGFTCTPATFTESGEQIVTVEYNGNSAMFVVYVHDNGTWSYAGNNVFERKCGTCDEVLESKTINLTLNSETLEMNNQDTGALVATVTDNFECDVIFTSSDDNVVSVDENGNITAKSIGDATVTATIKDTDITATCEITVLPRTFTLTWVVDGVSTEEKLNEAAEIIKPENPEKTGYAFDGWTPELPDVMPADDLTITASFTANSYDATFDANGGAWAEGETEMTVSTAYDAEIVAPDAPAKQGYVFTGWTPEVGIMDSVDGKTFVAKWAAADDTLYVVETYTMNVSGEYEESTVDFVGTTDETVTATYEIADGFALDTEKSVLSGTVAADGSLVLKVYINRNAYTVTTIVDGSSVQETYLYGETVVKPGNPTKEGYSFIGWNAEFPETMPVKNIVITALWSANSYNAVFDANEGAWTDGLNKKTFSVKFDSEIIAPETPVRQGYIFSGWTYEGENLGTNLGAMDNINGKTFTAGWIASTDTVYTVETYTMNTSGEYVKSVQTFSGTTNEPVTVTPSVATGFTLNTEKSVLEGVISADNSLVLKVFIDRNVYTVTTVVDGEETEISCYYGSAIPTIETPVKTGYAFIDWDNTIPVTMPAEDIILTAIFTVNKYDAVFNANGGAWADGATEKAVSTEYGADIIAPEAPAKDGYAFSGWAPEIGVMDDVNGKSFTATWTAATDTNYTVETYTMNTSSEYEKTSQTFIGATGESVAAEYTVPTGFTLNAEKSVLEGTIAADNSLVLKVYVDRNTYTFTTVVDGVSTPTAYLYGSMVSEPVTPSKTDYKFIKWNGTIPETMPAKNVTITAVFEKCYVCPDCGNEILGEDAIGEHIATEEKAKIKATIKIKNNNGSKTINYGETLKLTAIVTDKPADAKIYWYVDGAKKGEGETFNVSFESGTKTVEVKLVDSNGNAIKNASGNEISDSESVTIKSGFFQKIISFFKNLFGMNRTVVQSIFKGTL